MPRIVITMTDGNTAVLQFLSEVVSVEVDGIPVFGVDFDEKLRRIIGELGELAMQVGGQPTDVLSRPIDFLELSERTRNCLRRRSIECVGDLVQRSTRDLIQITNFGRRSLDEVIIKLAVYGLSLSPTDFKASD